jgi:putative FmdB family regulatory protein
VPILEFVCESCQDQFDKFTRSMRAHVVDLECPTCGGGDIRRMISAFAVAAATSRSVGSAIPSAMLGSHGPTGIDC